MGSDTTVVYTSPATNVRVYRETTGSADVQYVRAHQSTANTPTAWALSTTASQCIAADVQRTALTFTNCGSAVVYLCPTGTTPTALLYLVLLNPGETYVVDSANVRLAWNALANAGSSGNLQCWAGTAV